MSVIDLRQQTLRTACVQAALEVLETMFFEFPTEEPALQEQPPESVSLARAVFSGGARGELQVALSGACPRTLAAAFLGIDEEEAGEAEQRSMVVELANVLCGSTMSRIQPSSRLHIEQPLFATTPPQTGPWISFPLEAGRMSVYARIEEES